MSPLELVDDRFGELARELRAARPVTSEGLRERVHALTPRRAPRFEFNLRKLAPAVALAAIAVSLAVAGGLGLEHGSTGAEQSLRVPKVSTPGSQFSPVPHAEALQQKAFGRDALAPVVGRLQQYDADLTVRVDNRDDLSKTTQDALRFTRRLGGFVVWARYAAPSDGGDSELALRVPVDRVQAAIAHFSAYGELVRQRIVLKDLQQRVDDLTARIGRLKAEIATINQQLAGVLTPEKRAALEQRLRRDQARVATLAWSRRSRCSRVVRFSGVSTPASCRLIVAISALRRPMRADRSSTRCWRSFSTIR